MTVLLSLSACTDAMIGCFLVLRTLAAWTVVDVDVVFIFVAEAVAVAAVRAVRAASVARASLLVADVNCFFNFAGLFPALAFLRDAETP